MRALRGLSAEEFLNELFGRKLFFWNQTSSGLDFAYSQLFLLASTREKAIVPDLREARWQNVHEKSSDKFVGAQRHILPAAAVSVIPPLKRNGTVFQLENTVVGDSHPVGVASEIFHDASSVFKWRLAVDHPLLVVTDAQKSLINIRYLLLQQRQELSAKFTRKHSYREKELFPGGLPFAQIGKPARGDDAMNMGMKAEILAPGM